MTSKPKECHFAFSIALPWLLQIPNRTFRTRSGHNECGISTLKQNVNLDSSSGTSAHVLFRGIDGLLTSATDAEVPGAMLSYTRVSIEFTRKIEAAEPTENETETARNSARRYLNRFLDAYRYVSKDTRVRCLSQAEFHKVRSRHALHFVTRSRVKKRVVQKMGVMFDEQDPLCLGKTEEIPLAQIEELTTRLESGQEPLPEWLLLLNAESYIRSGEYKLAVIDMNTALDIVSERQAFHWLTHKGTSKKDSETCLNKMFTMTIVEQILIPAIPESARGSFRWEDWRQQCRPLRNRVVHDGYEPTCDEAEASYEIVSSCCKYIASLEPASSEEQP